MENDEIPPDDDSEGEEQAETVEEPGEGSGGGSESETVGVGSGECTPELAPGNVDGDEALEGGSGEGREAPAPGGGGVSEGDLDERLAAMEREKRELLEGVDDLEDLSLEDIEDMKEAIEENLSFEEELEKEWKPEEISEDLQAKIEAELARKKEEEEEEEEVMTAEKLTAYMEKRRDKIWYHALWFLVFNVDDHTLSKEALYDQLKEVTSSSPVDPIHKQVFYFGLSPLLRLKLFDNNILRYGFTGFKVAVNVDNLKKILEEVGEPIPRRPVIEKEEEMEMIKSFLSDDFTDI
ncbi:MAG: hypothetical protein ACTSU5_10740 [Promethearchaeota archaeon]